MAHSIDRPSPDARQAAVSGRQVAVIGAVAGLLSAAIAIPTTLISSERASDAAIATVNRQLAGETERSRAEFLRAQRREVYAQVLLHQNELSVAEAELYKAILKAAEPAEVKALEATQQKALRVLRSGVSIIDILGSNEVRLAFNRLATDHELKNVDLLQLKIVYSQSGSNTIARSALRKRNRAQVQADDEKIIVSKKALIDAARGDMGTR